MELFLVYVYMALGTSQVPAQPIMHFATEQQCKDAVSEMQKHSVHSRWDYCKPVHVTGGMYGRMIVYGGQAQRVQ